MRQVSQRARELLDLTRKIGGNSAQTKGDSPQGLDHAPIQTGRSVPQTSNAGAAARSSFLGSLFSYLCIAGIVYGAYFFIMVKRILEGLPAMIAFAVGSLLIGYLATASTTRHRAVKCVAVAILSAALYILVLYFFFGD